MLDATIRINSIDYENTLHHIFPVVSEKVLLTHSKNMIVRLFQQLGDAALPVLIGISYRLPVDTKDELLIRGLNAYAPVLKDKLNGELQKDRWGHYFTIGSLFIGKQDGIILDIGRIAVDYQRLLNNEQVSSAIEDRLGRWNPLVPLAKTAAGVAPVFAGNAIERKGLDLLQQDGIKARMLELLKSTLFKYGIRIDVNSIQIMQVPKSTEEVIETREPFTLTERMEDDIISALSGYLRDNIADGLVMVGK